MVEQISYERHGQMGRMRLRAEVADHGHRRGTGPIILPQEVSSGGGTNAEQVKEFRGDSYLFYTLWLALPRHVGSGA
ncbi:MAG: hypothetical protein ABSH49_35260 [Bryobacteraceae bacterium]